MLPYGILSAKGEEGEAEYSVACSDGAVRMMEIKQREDNQLSLTEKGLYTHEDVSDNLCALMLDSSERWVVSVHS
jgi:hypothetical protein